MLGEQDADEAVDAVPVGLATELTFVDDASSLPAEPTGAGLALGVTFVEGLEDAERREEQLFAGQVVVGELSSSHG